MATSASLLEAHLKLPEGVAQMGLDDISPDISNLGTVDDGDELSDFCHDRLQRLRVIPLYLSLGVSPQRVVVTEQGDNIFYQGIPAFLEHGVKRIRGEEAVSGDIVNQKLFQVGSSIGLKQRVDVFTEWLGIHIVVPGIHMATDKHRAVEKTLQLDVNPGLSARTFHDTENLLAREESQVERGEFGILSLLLGVDIGDEVVHPLVLAEVVAPQRLPFVGITAKPVTDDDGAISAMLGQLGKQLNILFAAVVGKSPVGGEVEVIGLLSLQVKFVKVTLNESGDGVVVVDSLSLSYKSRVKLDSLIALQTAGPNDGISMGGESRVSPLRPHKQFVAVAATAAQVQDSESFPQVALLVYEFLQVRLEE